MSYEDTASNERLAKAKLIKRTVTGVVVVLIVLILGFGSFRVIDAGERGLVLRLGEIQRIMEPGLNFKTPFIERVVKLEVRTTKQEVEASAASNDLQIVTSNVAIQYNLIPEEIGELYEEIGTSYRSRIIDPAIQDSIKATTAKFTAEELVTKRAIASEEMEVLLRERLLEAHIAVTNVDIVNFDFSPAFNEAIEQKVTAEQDALREENKLKQVEFEAQQRIERATAEAEAIRIQAQAINSQGGADYVQLQAIEKWDGILPQQFVPGSAIPFLNLIR